MKNTHYNKGFTLVEVMLAAAILVIGLMLVAGAFPVGIKMTAIATERTIGTIAATEAFAKIKLLGDPNEPGQIPPYGVDFQNSNLSKYWFVNFEQTLQQTFVDPAEFDYPSADTGETKLYHWTALLQRDGTVDRKVHAVVFVTRTAGSGATYPDPYDLDNTIPIPKPIIVFFDSNESWSQDPTGKTLILAGDDLDTTFKEDTLISRIADGAVLVTLRPDPQDNSKILIHKLNVVDRQPEALILKEGIPTDLVNNYFWVIPTATGSSRNPCIGVYQETLTF